MFERDYSITGKHATYVKYLAAKNAKITNETDVPSAASLFERYIDVYMNASVWGLLYNRTAQRDTTSKDHALIYADAFANERDNCVFLYRMAMLLDKSVELSPEERINRAFRYDTQADKADAFKANMELFNSYVRGGIELLYEHFTDGCSSQDDYLNKTYEIITTFKREIEGISYADELAKLLK